MRDPPRRTSTVWQPLLARRLSAVRTLGPTLRALRALVLSLVVLAAAAAAVNAARSAPAGLHDALLALESKSLNELWPALEELKKSYASAPAEIKALSLEVYALPGKAKLAGAALLFGQKEATFQDAGQIALQQMARKDGDKELRLGAIRLLKKAVKFEEAYLTLKDIATTASDPDLKIEASLSLWELDNHQSARQPLIKLLEDTRPSVRAAAALALGETGYYQAPVAEIIRATAKEPSDAGSRARLLVRLMDRAQPTGRPSGASDPPTSAAGAGRSAAEASTDTASVRSESASGLRWAAVLQEVEAAIQRNSLYGERWRSREFYTAAIRGMVGMLDQYSTFLDPDELRQTEASRLGTFWGLCADLVKPGKDAPLVVARVYPEGPAYAAGLRTGDRIVEVNGVTTHDRDRGELERLTSGEVGSEVRLLVARWGWTEPRMVTLERGEVAPPSVRSVMLPGKVGFLRVSRFTPTVASEFEKALDALEAAGLQALIIDLRRNPGGNLKQAVKLADLFLADTTRPILTERSPFRVTEWRADPEAKPAHPLAILVNRSTASAAEVVAGALQDFGKAVLIGERTYGKGVKQVSLPLSPAAESLLGGPSRLFLTATRLYLPSGRPIQPDSDAPRGAAAPARDAPRGGVEPDIFVADMGDAFPSGHPSEVQKVQWAQPVDEYIHQNYTAMKNLFQEGDLWDPVQFPGFEELYESLGTKLERGEVRQALLEIIRRHLEDERGEEIIADWRNDDALERAIVEIFRRAGRDLAGIPEYRGILDRPSRRDSFKQE